MLTNKIRFVYDYEWKQEDSGSHTMKRLAKGSIE